MQSNKAENKENRSDDRVVCPKCGSTSITLTRRGYSALFGYIGANQMYYKCGKCTKKWKVKRR